MAEPEMESHAVRAALRREEADLAVFFDAERAASEEMSAAFVETVVADALAISGSRLKIAPRRPRRLLARAPLLRPLGGWIGAAAIAGCAALGFWAGAVGTGTDLMAATFWTDIASIDAQADGVAGFYELADTEG